MEEYGWIVAVGQQTHRLNMHNLQHLLICVLSLCGMLQLCGADRGSKFSPGPDGTQCILRGDHAEAGEFTYDHVDDSGHFCKCDLCSRGKILHQACLCDPNSSGYLEPSDCRLVNVGEQMMPDRNNCTKGFDCRICNHPWIVKVKCGLHGPDTECKCADGYYQTSGEECKLYPTCDKGFEPVPGHGEDYSEIRCKQCQPGYYQPTNNSTDKCRPHTNCTTRAGTIQADSRCLNGPSTGGDPSGESKPSMPSLEETPPGLPQDILTNILPSTGTPAPLDLPDGGSATTNRTTDVSNGTYVTGNTTGPTVLPTCMWSLDFWSVLIGFVLGALVTYVLIYAYQSIKHSAWLRDLRGAGNQSVDGSAANLRGAGNQSHESVDGSAASKASECVPVVVIDDENENEAHDITRGDETADKTSIDDDSDVFSMDSYSYSAGKAEQGQGELKRRIPSTSSSSSSEDQRQDSKFMQ